MSVSYPYEGKIEPLKTQTGGHREYLRKMVITKMEKKYGPVIRADLKNPDKRFPNTSGKKKNTKKGSSLFLPVSHSRDQSSPVITLFSSRTQMALDDFRGAKAGHTLPRMTTTTIGITLSPTRMRSTTTLRRKKTECLTSLSDTMW